MTQTTTNGSFNGLDAKLWAATDKLRGHMDAAEYKHVVLGLIFLKYISDAFHAQYDALSTDEYANPEDPDEYLAENVFFVPEGVALSAAASQRQNPNIGVQIDHAMAKIEADRYAEMNHRYVYGELASDSASSTGEKRKRGGYAVLTSATGITFLQRLAVYGVVAFVVLIVGRQFIIALQGGLAQVDWDAFLLQAGFVLVVGIAAITAIQVVASIFPLIIFTGILLGFVAACGLVTSVLFGWPWSL